MKSHSTARIAVAAVCAGLALGGLAAPAAADPAAPLPVEPTVPADPDAAVPADPDGAVTGTDTEAEGPVNVTYRARIDGLSRRALIKFRSSDTEFQTADPTMLPGRTFEAQSALGDRRSAGMRVEIDLPYSANLHCEIEIDDQLVAQADTFVAPRLTRPKNDPDYGALQCGAPLTLDPVAAPPVLPATDPGPASVPAEAPTPDGPEAGTPVDTPPATPVVG